MNYIINVLYQISKLIICKMSVRLYPNTFGNFSSIELGKVPKDAEIFEVEHITFSYRNLFIILRKSAGNQFSWKIP